MIKQILVVAAHPDDEALGCGGALFKYKALGYEIHLRFMTEGISPYTEMNIRDEKSRNSGFLNAMEALKPTSYEVLGFEDNQLDKVSLLEIVQRLETSIQFLKPSIVFTHFWNDLNIDHCITHRAALTACRPSPKPFIEKILAFEILSTTELAMGAHQFCPNYFIDITNWIDQKLEYLKYYDTEMRVFPHPRSYENVKALAQTRGGMINVASAEGFYLIRGVENDK